MRVFILTGFIGFLSTFTVQANWQITSLKDGEGVGTPVKDIVFTEDTSVGHLVLGGEGGYQTIDAGQTWEEEEVDFTAELPTFPNPLQVLPLGLQFDQNENRYAIGNLLGSNMQALGKEEGDGNFNTLMKWPEVSRPLISFSDPELGVMLMGDSLSNEVTVAAIEDESADSISWFSDRSPGSPFMDIDCSPESKGWAVGMIEEDGVTEPVLWETSDGGRNWRPQPLGLDKNPTRIGFMDETTGFIIGEEGLFMKTTDGGETWNERSLNRKVELLDVHFMDGQTGVIGGTDGNLYITHDGGNSWEELLGFVSTDIHSVFLDENGTIYAGDNAGNVFRSKVSINSINPAQTPGIEIPAATENDQLVIGFPEQLFGKEVTISIYDRSGQKVLKKEAEVAETITLDLSILDSGTYFLSVEGSFFSRNLTFQKL